ncbi:MAG: tRNA (N(6)-L-threonylcarbamoyladenosine(37)-C(2))-methylthiotransferase MtaB [Candidatus Omnitrophica bacterium]|nr:tRNA (N(6)-L-threonylcarbamoyladenosine(37)-C(2))-methylthiotransferase MtaB [Candidatus Omnitrophota bacterium]
MFKVKFFTVGCKVNQYDTQLLREQVLSCADFKEVNDFLPADIYIINTCTVTHKADTDSFYLIRKVKKENPRAKVVVTGCLAELEEDVKRIRDVERIDLIVKNRDKFKIPFLLNSFISNSSFIHSSCRGISYFKSHTRAFLKVQEGCDNFCSYCKVPRVRGRSRSKNPQDILEEFKRLIKNGYKEIVLCGVCLGSYGKDIEPSLELIDLLVILDNLGGDFRIRLSSIEAWDITERFIQNIDKIKKLCPHLHIPIQSGDRDIIFLMNRPIDPTGYLEIIQRLRERIPSLVITTDVMVGFPQEKEKNFLNTVEIIRKIRPLKVHIFSFSARKDTAAYFLKEKIPSWQIRNRVAFLKKLTAEISFEVKKSFLGKTGSVLFEQEIKESTNRWWYGLSEHYLKVKVNSFEELKNRFKKTELCSLDEGYIIGVVQ